MPQHLPCPLLAALAALPVLAGCSLAPADTPADTAGVVAAAWRADTARVRPRLALRRSGGPAFSSPELNALIARARTANFDILAAVARIRQADAALVSAGAPLLPTVTATAPGPVEPQLDRPLLSGRRVHRRAPCPTAITSTRTYSLIPSVSYEIDLWGRLRATRDAALATALANRFDQQTVALTAVTGVATTWFQALALQDRLDVAQRNLHDAEEILRAIQARLDAGTASQLDVEQQAALVAGIRATIPDLRSQMEQQINGLGILTGQPPEAITARPGTLNTLSLPEVAPGLPSDLLARRPDVAYAEASLASARANIARRPRRDVSQGGTHRHRRLAGVHPRHAVRPRLAVRPGRHRRHPDHLRQRRPAGRMSSSRAAAPTNCSPTTANPSCRPSPMSRTP